MEKAGGIGEHGSEVFDFSALRFGLVNVHGVKLTGEIPPVLTRVIEIDDLNWHQ